MNSNQIQQICESIILGALNGGNLAGYVFRHSDNPKKAKTDSISVKAGGPVPQLSGPGGHRVEVEVELKSKTPTRNAALHGEALERLTTVSVLRSAALAAGLRTTDDFYILDEEIGGDRAETKNLRKRTITVPMLINTEGTPPITVPLTFGEEEVLFGDEGHTFGES